MLVKLTSFEIEEMKKKLHKLDENYINVYKRFDKNPIEILKLFSYSLNILNRIDTEKFQGLNQIKQKTDRLIVEFDGKLNSEWHLEMVAGDLVNKNMEEINYIIELVFRNSLEGGDKNVPIN